MTEMLIVLYIVGAIATGIFSCGASIAYFQRKYPELAEGDYRRDLKDAILTATLSGLIWPAAAIQTYFLYDRLKYGWYIRYRPLTRR